MVRQLNYCFYMLLKVLQGPSLMGREWLNEIRITWQELNFAAETSNNVAPMNNEVGKLLQKKEGLGVMNTFEARLQVKEGAKPRFCKARPVPFALKAAIDSKLDYLENEGILEPCQSCTVNGQHLWCQYQRQKVRYDFVVITMSPLIQFWRWINIHFQSLITLFFATISTGKVFSKIDLIYNPCLPTNKNYRGFQKLCHRTHCGLFYYTRLPFAMAFAPSIFQKVMDTVLQSLPNTICYLDDILVSGATKEEHFHNLEMVLQ